MALAAPSTQLGCGRDIDEVWDHLDRGPDAHELTCSYCQAARSDLARLAQATQAMRDEDETNPDLEPGPQVLDRILTVARAEVRRGRRLPLDQPRGVETVLNTVSEQTVTAVVRRTGDLNGQVQIRRCTLTPDPGPTSHVAARTTRSEQLLDEGVPDPGPASVRVSLRVSVARDLPIAEVSEQLRVSVIEAVAREVGMLVVSVDIAVEDVHDG